MFYENNCQILFIYNCKITFFLSEDLKQFDF